MEKLRALWHTRAVLFVAGLFLGALVILAIRFFSYAPEQTHHHANFAVYLNGVQEEFKSSKYYQEIAVCSSSHDITTPQQRAHMHDNVNSVVHVHDHAVTWGQFFDVLGWQVGEDFIRTDSGTFYIADEANKLNIYLNGQNYTGLASINNMVIKSRDRLLISFGTQDTPTLQRQYKSVANTAERYNNIQDPAACQGSHEVTIKDRFENLF